MNINILKEFKLFFYIKICQILSLIVLVSITLSKQL